jgi:peptide/nickel transport system permease protein
MTDPLAQISVASPVPSEHDDDSASLVPLRQSVIQRFLRRPLVILCFGILAAFTLMALFAPRITPDVTSSTNLFFQNGFGVHGPSFANFPIELFGLTPPDPNTLVETSVLAGVTYGARGSLAVAVSAACLSVLLGTVLGAAAGYYGRWLDTAITGLIDLLLAIPLIPLVAAILLIAPVSFGTPVAIATLFALVGWPPIARLVRAVYLELREQEFTEAARAAGIGSWRIIFRHVLPNALPVVLPALALTVSYFLVTEATLEFLSLGVTTQPTWGNLLGQSFNSILTGSWWALFFPGACLALVAIVFNTLADELRRSLQPAR